MLLELLWNYLELGWNFSLIIFWKVELVNRNFLGTCLELFLKSHRQEAHRIWEVGLYCIATSITAMRVLNVMLHPELRGKYIAVCGSTEDRHGIVLAKNQLAKQCGVKTGEVIWERAKSVRN